MKTIRDTIRDKNPRAKEIKTRLGQNYAKHYNDFAVRENCLWMDGRLATPKDMSSAVLNRLRFNHHGRDKCLQPQKMCGYHLCTGTLPLQQNTAKAA